eukprot:7187615-Pyramimonas_sp.AAC.1
MARLAKPEGGVRLIALTNTLCRVWGKLRKSVTCSWQELHGCLEIWGTRKRHSSTDSAFAHNLSAGIATLLGDISISVLLDMTRCFEIVHPAQLIK